MSAHGEKLPAGALEAGQLKQIAPIMGSRALEERSTPSTIIDSRQRRFSRGSGTTLQEVNQLLNQFRQVQKMMRNLTRGKGPKGLMRMLN